MGLLLQISLLWRTLRLIKPLIQVSTECLYYSLSIGNEAGFFGPPIRTPQRRSARCYNASEDLFFYRNISKSTMIPLGFLYVPTPIDHISPPTL